MAFRRWAITFTLYCLKPNSMTNPMVIGHSVCLQPSIQYIPVECCCLADATCILAPANCMGLCLPDAHSMTWPRLWMSCRCELSLHGLSLEEPSHGQGHDGCAATS